MPESQKRRRQSVVATGSIYSKRANAGRRLLSLVHSGCRATAARRGGWRGEESGSYLNTVGATDFVLQGGIYDNQPPHFLCLLFSFLQSG